MAKYLFKLIAWLFILLLLAESFWWLFRGIDNLIVYFNEGADPASILHIVPNVPPDLYVKLDWRTDDRDTGRKMEQLTRVDIQSAYLRAWLQWNLSLLKKAPYGLQTYFVGPALADLSRTIYAAKDWLVEQADMTHVLQLHFYSADGSIVSFTDWDATVVDIIHDKSGAAVFSGETVAAYRVVMFLEDGNWRVRHWVRISNQPLDATVTPLHTPSGFVGEDTVQHVLSLDKRPYNVAGINYYPRDTPWDRFWLRYTPSIIDHDFDVIHTLGLNTIRIFIPFDQFGGPLLGTKPVEQPTATSASVKPNAFGQVELDRLTDLLARASKHHLHVIVTLFDFRSDYSLLHWPAADRQLEVLLTHFKDNPSILAWDLKNEPDQDYHAAGKILVDSWLAHVAYFARRYDPHHLLTIGWSTAQAAQAHIPIIDFVSFHYYAPVAQLASAYAALQAAIPDQPIVLGEFGLPTWNSFFFPNGHSEAEQAIYYAAILRFLRTSKSAGYIAWTLYDFNYVPPTVAGSWPWQTGPQKAMGILYSNGKAKIAARFLAPSARLNPPSLPTWQYVVKPFWITVSIAIVSGISSMAFLLLLRRRLRRNKT